MMICPWTITIQYCSPRPVLIKPAWHLRDQNKIPWWVAYIMCSRLLLMISRLDVLARASLRTFTSRSHLWISLLCFFLCFFSLPFLIHTRTWNTSFYIFNTIYGAFDSFVPQFFLFIHELRMPFYIFNAIYGALDSFVLLKLLAALAALNNFLSFLNILPLLWIHSFQLCWAFHAFNYFSVATCSFTLPLSPLLPT